MKELNNKINITGELIEKALEEKVINGRQAISGTITLRTADKSEHEINLFAYRFKADENGNETSEEAYFYLQYKELMTFKSKADCAEGEYADVVEMSQGSFRVNDYLSKKDTTVKTVTQISGRFIKKIEPQQIENTTQTAEFDIDCQIESMTEEIVRDEPTGRIIIKGNAIGQKMLKDKSYSADSLIPVRLVVPMELADDFKSAGFYEGACMGTFYGNIVNSVETETVTTKAVFGADKTEFVKKYVNGNILLGATNMYDIYSIDLNDDIMNTLIAKRKQKLEEVKTGANKKSANVSAAMPKTNPLASSVNPFAK